MPVFDSYEVGAPAADSPAAVFVLGPFRLALGGQVAPFSSEHKAAQLLVCLVTAPEQRVLRTQLLDRMWPHTDPTLAGQSLQSLVHSLHKLTRPFLAGASIILHEDGYYGLSKTAGVWVDLHEFEALSAQSTALLAKKRVAEGINCCRGALGLYRGDLATSMDLPAILERERLRVHFLDLLTRMADHHYRYDEFSEALYYLHRLLAHEPCREDAHRKAMRCYMKLHQRVHALRQYRLCCTALAMEFDMLPEPETVVLFEQIWHDPASL